MELNGQIKLIGGIINFQSNLSFIDMQSRYRQKSRSLDRPKLDRSGKLNWPQNYDNKLYLTPSITRWDGFSIGVERM
jgi:hypothetical protein